MLVALKDGQVLRGVVFRWTADQITVGSAGACAWRLRRPKSSVRPCLGKETDGRRGRLVYCWVWLAA